MKISDGNVFAILEISILGKEVIIPETIISFSL